MLGTGALLADRYRLARRIAVGGMGEVWEAGDTRLDRWVAVKVLKPELSGDAEFVHRFRAEARTTASLNHPGIAAVHDYGETAAPDGSRGDVAYLVMELVEGESLAAILARQRRLSPEHALDVLQQAGGALQAAHERGLVHRDVKPGNILLTPAGRVKLTDFGIAKAVDAVPVTRSGVVMGTAHYISPEQASGRDAGPASDVYSLGVVGFECLAGVRPFLSDSAVNVAMMHIRDAPPPLPGDVPPEVRGLVEACLLKDPRQRYATGGEVASAAASVLAGRGLLLPTGMTGPTAMIGPTGTLHQGQQQTALLPPGALTGPGTSLPYTGYQQGPQRPTRRGRTVGWVLTGLLLLGALALGAWGLTQALEGATDPPPPTAEPVPPAEPTDAPPPEPTDGAEAPPPPPVTEEPTEPPADTVTVDPLDYIGDPADKAAKALRRDGLEVEIHRQDGGSPDDPSSCIVSGVNPSGEVPEGSTVIVSCFEPEV